MQHHRRPWKQADRIKLAAYLGSRNALRLHARGRVNALAEDRRRRLVVASLIVLAIMVWGIYREFGGG